MRTIQTRPGRSKWPQNRHVVWLLLLSCAGLGCRRPELARQVPSALVDRLEEPVRVSYRCGSLGDFVGFVRQSAGVPVVLDAESVREKGVSLKTPLPFEAGGISMKSFLTLALEQLDLEWRIRDNSLVIMSRSEAERQRAGTLGPEVVEVDAGWRKRILSELRRPATIDFTESTLREVLDALGKLTRENIVLDLPALQEEGISPDTPVNIRVSGISMRSILSLILESIDLTWLVRHEVVYLTGQARVAKERITDAGPVLLPADPAKTRSLLAKLRRPITVDFRRAPLGDVADFFARQTGENILWDVPALNEPGPSPDTPITFKASGVPVGRALRLLLKQADLAWTVRHEVIVLIPIEEANPVAVDGDGQ
jgi:hypothetical protein